MSCFLKDKQIILIKDKEGDHRKEKMIIETLCRVIDAIADNLSKTSKGIISVVEGSDSPRSISPHTLHPWPKKPESDLSWRMPFNRLMKTIQYTNMTKTNTMTLSLRLHGNKSKGNTSHSLSSFPEEYGLMEFFL